MGHTLDHRCQPFSGIKTQDPDFPMTYQRDSWCWSPDLGFHRESAPAVRLYPGISPRGSQLVDAGNVHPYQAFVLGIGSGTSNTPRTAPVSEMLARLWEASAGPGWETWKGSAGALAELGRQLRRLADNGTQERLSDNDTGRREWFRVATEPFATSPRLGPWAARLTAGLAGQLTARQLAKYAAEGDAGYQGGAPDGTDAERVKWRDYACSQALANITGERPHHGGMRSTCRAFLLTGPEPRQVVKWWRHVIHSAEAIT